MSIDKQDTQFTESFFAQQIAPIDGWLSYEEGKLLHDLAKNSTGKGAIVEIGSWQGKSSVCLGLGIKHGNNGSKVYAVDPHTGSEEHQHLSQDGRVWTFDRFQKNIADNGVADVIIPVIKTSGDAAKEVNVPLEVIFIDGAHDYDNVKLDFDLWSPKLVEGGYIVFHDSTWPGVHKVLSDHLYHSNNFDVVKLLDGITYARKIHKASLPIRIINEFNLQKLNLSYSYKYNRRKIREQFKQMLRF